MTNDAEDNILVRIGEFGLIPVCVLERVVDTDSICNALMEGGLPCVEITLRSDAAMDALRVASGIDNMLVGAGTVLTQEQAEMVVDSGAMFIVSPGLDMTIVEWCQSQDVTVIPGIATPSEISLALSMGINILKFFPAVTLGGPKALRAMGGPFRGVRFIPTGGVKEHNLAEYTREPNVHACGGSWIVHKQILEDREFQEITRLTKEALDIVRISRRDDRSKSGL